MTLLYTWIQDVSDAAAARNAGADCVYMRLQDGLNSRLADFAPGCPLAIELTSHTDSPLLENLIGIIPAPDQELAASLAEKGFKTLLLAPTSDHLLKTYEPWLLEQFISFCRMQNLKLGLGGRIEAPDIPRLLLLEPDFFVFPSDVGLNLTLAFELNHSAITLARDLIEIFQESASLPLAAAADGVSGSGFGKKQQNRRDTSITNIESTEADHLFVHDLVLSASIGAYNSETKAPQRIRLNVDLAIKRQSPRGGHDMRDIFSYDLIVDTIKLILSRGHIQFIETLAEDIASAMLTYTRIASAKVRVEKLDILQACVGIEIFREKLAESAEITPLFSEAEIKSGGR